MPLSEGVLSVMAFHRKLCGNKSQSRAGYRVAKSCILTPPTANGMLLLWRVLTQKGEPPMRPKKFTVGLLIQDGGPLLVTRAMKRGRIL